ncbi:hypothetical protein GWK47_041322 [Chionoecetes opilio]|uniref:Uncharacterized protein n=1 Tax=Chionoecetes opilio TaxID=41210 RepID=A0A8J4YBC4_CHIOP|nr:hypothetical protein GWK47_041322 [Chionoecetes opilio]
MLGLGSILGLLAAGGGLVPPPHTPARPLPAPPTSPPCFCFQPRAPGLPPEPLSGVPVVTKPGLTSGRAGKTPASPLLLQRQFLNSTSTPTSRSAPSPCLTYQTLVLRGDCISNTVAPLKSGNCFA